jgi:hypothetical protein
VKWSKLLSQKNLKNSFDLYLLRAKDPSTCLLISMPLTSNKEHTSIIIRSTYSSFSQPQKSIILNHKKITSPAMHSIYARLISYHQKTSHRSHF